MHANVRLDLDSADEQRNEYAEDFATVAVEFPAEDGAAATQRCTECGDDLNEDGTTVDGGSASCDASEIEFDDNGNFIPGTDAHKPEPIPLSWVNSAHITADESDDTVTVSISVGDPRGGFVMRVERMRYTDLETGKEVDELRLSVPTPDDSMPHMTLTPLASAGYYRIS